uniref:Uncharacterized protein n=1 Tax=Rhizophora mucronata TaxID=61149 RepID=A0A2P2PMN9_RHIMU
MCYALGLIVSVYCLCFSPSFPLPSTKGDIYVVPA